VIGSADDGAFGGEVLAEFVEELIAAFEQGAEGGVGEVGGLPGEDGDFKLNGLVGLVPLARGAVGVSAVIGELGDEGGLPFGSSVNTLEIITPPGYLGTRVLEQWVAPSTPARRTPVGRSYAKGGQFLRVRRLVGV
jgi:hypothetical protein